MKCICLCDYINEVDRSDRVEQKQPYRVGGKLNGVERRLRKLVKVRSRDIADTGEDTDAVHQNEVPVCLAACHASEYACDNDESEDNQCAYIKCGYHVYIHNVTLLSAKFTILYYILQRKSI